MTSLRSSVRPKSSKQPWGTILQPEFGMGHQKMTTYELDQTIDRLYHVPEKKESIHIKPKQKVMSSAAVSDMLQRLTLKSSEKCPETKRTQRHSDYRSMGIVNSYVWKGY